MTQVDRCVSVHGLKLHYRQTGIGSAVGGAGVPVIALHGHPGTAATWDGVAEAICANGDDGDAAGNEGSYRFLALTQRGYGESARASSYAYADFAGDVFGFADALGLDSFVLLGHSFGGTIASLAAGIDSSRLLGLVLEDSVLPRDPGSRLDLRRPEGEPAYDWDVALAIMSQFSDPDPAWWASLAHIGCPTLVLAGGSTSHVPQDLLAEAAEVIPQGRLVTLEGAGHTAHRTQPDRFVGEVRGFLEALGA
jgi:esterase